jgi:hypothetical protein
MSIEKSLESLGLTQMEALAYAYLVINPSSTGYRVARGIGKPTANVYRALESLGRKGAVLQDRATTPSFRALSPDDLLARLEHDFMQRKGAAAEKLASLQPDEGDERIYALNSPDQVLTRARIVLASSRRLVLVDAFGPRRCFWGTDITRMPCSYRQCVTMFTEELAWLKGRDLELVMGHAICAWLGWQRPGQPAN